VRAILRRTAGSQVKQEQVLLRTQGLELNAAARTVLLNGSNIDLTDVEFALLEVLMRAPGTVVTREEISESVLGRKFHPFDRSLDMHVSRLRRKLAESGAPEAQVKTIRGVGYQLTVSSNPQRARV
jgi:two-component system response regulator CpxR